MAKEINKDFWEIYSEIRPHAIVCTTNNVLKSNGELVMGAGIAKQFKEKFPNLPYKFGIQLRGRKEYNILLSTIDDIFIVGLQTKFHWKNPSDTFLIHRSLMQLRDLTRILGWERVLMTRPGCGNGGLDWGKVGPDFCSYLDERFYIGYN